MSTHTPYQAILFDLDGTLIDSAPCFFATLKEFAKHYDGVMPSYEQVRQQSSNGSLSLIHLLLDEKQLQQYDQDTLKEHFLSLYTQYLTTSLSLFDGVEAVLERLKNKQIPWGIVTNKPQRFVLPIINYLGLQAEVSVIISGDSTPTPKPHPAPIHLALKYLQLAPQHCLYVGDAERDIIAAKAAKMPALIARYGYLSATEMPDEWGALSSINHASELLEWI